MYGKRIEYLQKVIKKYQSDLQLLTQAQELIDDTEMDDKFQSRCSLSLQRQIIKIEKQIKNVENTISLLKNRILRCTFNMKKK